MPESLHGLLLCDDLLFSSRILGTARGLGLTMKAVRSVEELKALSREAAPQGLIVDLANPGLVITEMIDWLRQNGESLPRIVAYGSHVDTATLKAAREAGCAVVLPRSKFVEELPARLAEWLGAGQ